MCRPRSLSKSLYHEIVQTARTGNQKIDEGSHAAVTSSQTEHACFNVDRGQSGGTSAGGGHAGIFFGIKEP